jgi:AraC family transcriptional regulator
MSMFEEEYRKRINRLAESIEQNLAAEMTLELLAKQAGISPFHLHRLFLAYTGEPISGFVRRLRLAAGYSEVRKGKTTTILDVAVSVGYESVSSFVRAFRRRFGFTPGSTTKSNANSLSLWRTQKSATDKVVISPERIELRATQPIVGVMESGYQNRSFKKAAERAFVRTLKLVDQYELHSKLGRPCAAMFDDPDLSVPLEVRYFGGFEWLAPKPIPHDGLDFMSLQSGTYAVFVHRGSYASLWQTWNAAYRNWLPHSGFELRDVFPFEVYLNDPRTVRKESELITEIFIPVERPSL